MLSEELRDQRRGNITASGAHRIMAGWDKARPTDEFPTEIYDWMVDSGTKPQVKTLKLDLDCEVSGALIDAAWKAYRFDYAEPPAGLITYAEELACEEMFEEDPDVPDISNLPHIVNGNERELEAVERLSEATGIDFIHTGDNQIHVSENGIGATPDGIALDDMDLYATGCEVKCRSALHHARQLLIRDAASLIEHDFERYAQIQTGCLVLGVDHWYSAGFNPLARNKVHEFNYCRIERDDAFLKVFQQRAALVFKYKQAFIDARTPEKLSQAA